MIPEKMSPNIFASVSRISKRSKVKFTFSRKSLQQCVTKAQCAKGTLSSPHPVFLLSLEITYNTRVLSAIVVTAILRVKNKIYVAYVRASPNLTRCTGVITVVYHRYEHVYVVAIAKLMWGNPLGSTPTMSVIVLVCNLRCRSASISPRKHQDGSNIFGKQKKK